ncbi:hypothetical protein [Acetobacter fabarum]|uniref:hypothetical protein n=2 Tax=Acetobacter TaxID=434 RepID=UPI0037727255
MMPQYRRLSIKVAMAGASVGQQALLPPLSTRVEAQPMSCALLESDPPDSILLSDVSGKKLSVHKA